MSDTAPPNISEMKKTLTHYGVKGMKWGVRKDRVRSTLASAKQYKTLALGSVTPTAVLMGLGPPASVALGLGIFAVQQPPLSTGVAKGAEIISGVTRTAGSATLSTMQAATMSLTNTISTIQPTKRDD